ncbi:MAG: sugar phosphate isomerase/epimerase family protein [Planctomycetota bacterium]
MTPLRFAYNTNGFAFHRLDDAVAILAEIGYAGVAITLDVHHLDPFRTTRTDLAHLRAALRRRSLGVVVETGTRFLLDPRRKHEPTLVSAKERDRRIAFLKKAVDIAAFLDAETVSFWSGVKAPGIPAKTARAWLVRGCREVARYAAGRGVTVAFEPEPGMFVETLAGFETLAGAVGMGNFKLCLDVGHVPVTESFPPEEAVRRYATHIAAVHLDDTRGGHEHLLPGEGKIHWGKTLAAFRESKVSCLLGVELSRDSHRAVEAARQAMAYLKNIAGKK